MAARRSLTPPSRRSAPKHLSRHSVGQVFSTACTGDSKLPATLLAGQAYTPWLPSGTSTNTPASSVACSQATSSTVSAAWQNARSSGSVSASDRGISPHRVEAVGTACPTTVATVDHLRCYGCASKLAPCQTCVSANGRGIRGNRSPILGNRSSLTLHPGDGRSSSVTRRERHSSPPPVAQLQLTVGGATASTTSTTAPPFIRRRVAPGMAHMRTSSLPPATAQARTSLQYGNMVPQQAQLNGQRTLPETPGNLWVAEFPPSSLQAAATDDRIQLDGLDNAPMDFGPPTLAPTRRVPVRRGRPIVNSAIATSHRRSASSPAPEVNRGQAGSSSPPPEVRSGEFAPNGRGSPRSSWPWPTQTWLPENRVASEDVSCCSSPRSTVHPEGSLVNVAPGTLRRIHNDPAHRHGNATFVAGSLSTTSAGSSVSRLRSPHPECSRRSSGWGTPELIKPSTPRSEVVAWHQRLLEDAEAVASALEPSIPNAYDEEDSKLRAELANVSNALGRELSRLAEFVQWADVVISKAESTGPRSGGSERRFSGGCRMAAPTTEQRDPEQYYIGDGLIAQLLADAEAVA